MAGNADDFVAVVKSNNQDIDGILHDFRWDHLELTYSFPETFAEYSGTDADQAFDYPEATFSKFSDDAMAAAIAALTSFSHYTPLQFTKVDETVATAGFDANFRFANSDDAALGTATGYLPGSLDGGDMHFNNTINPGYSNPVLGSYDFYVTMHEIGHALGLTHGHEADGFGALPNDHNSIEYSIMTYHSYVGQPDDGSIHTTDGHYPQTLMQDDIAALQYLYGANFDYNDDDTTYKWQPALGTTFINKTGQGQPSENIIFATIWDGDGNDTYDLSAYATGVSIDLNPGKGSTFLKAQLADLDGQHSGAADHFARANIFNALLYKDDARSLIENAIGGGGHDKIEGNQAGNFLDGGGGNDILNGNAGMDQLLGGKGTNTVSGGADHDVGLFGNSRLFYSRADLADNARKYTGAGLAAGEITTTDKTVEDHLFNVERVDGELIHKLTPGLTKAFAPISPGAPHLQIAFGSPSVFVDLSKAFPDGLDFYGTTYGGLWVNNNGNVTFKNSLPAFTAGAIGGGTNPIIAPFWADVDTNITAGQAKHLHGMVTYDVDAVHGSFTATWDNVGYFNATAKDYVHKINDFQLQLIDQGSGDFEIIFRYTAINWTTGDANGGDKGVGGSIARTGFTSGSGKYGEYYELPQSADQKGMLDLENSAGNTGIAGVWQWRVTNGGIHGIGGDKDDKLDGDDAPNSIDGGKGNDTITGGKGNDTLVGGAGNDTLNGNQAPDRMFGGAGDDNLIVDDVKDVVREEKGEGIDTVQSSINFLLPLSKSSEVENLVLIDNALKGTGNELNNIITGNDKDNILDGGPGNDTLDGGLGNDTLKGNLGDDTLLGAPGKDMMDGGLGFDIVVYNSPVILDMVNPNAGAGDAQGDKIIGVELILGSGGDDQLLGGAGNDSLEGRDGADKLDGGGGINTLSYTKSALAVTVSLDPFGASPDGGDATGDTISNFRNLTGSANDDVLTGIGFNGTGFGPLGMNVLIGGEGSDKLFGGENNDILLGGVGDDYLDGGKFFVFPNPPFVNKFILDKDVIDGGDGIDTVTYQGTGSSIGVTLALGVDGKMAIGMGSADASGDKISNVENIIGSDNGDKLTGNNKANEIEGGKGNDILSGGGGTVVDTLDGGEGSDSLDYSKSKSAITVALAAADVEFIGAGGDAAGDKLKNFEGAIGSDFNDKLIGNDDVNIFRAGKGDDFVQGGIGSDKLDGGAGNDDALSYLNDTVGVKINLTSQSTVDLNGKFNGGTPGQGGEADGDLLSGFEHVLGGSGIDDITGSALKNILRGGGGADTIDGKAESDTIEGGVGIDKLIGGLGNDTVSYESSISGVSVKLTEQGVSDTKGLAGAPGIAQSNGDADGDLLWGFEHVTGGGAGDLLWGDKGANTLMGLAGNDELRGGSGADTLNGGLGADILRADFEGVGVDGGIAGIDNFVYANKADSPSVGGVWAAGTGDEIFGFKVGSDNLDFKPMDPSATAGDQAYHFLGINKAFDNKAGAIVVFTTAVANDFEVRIDTDGVGGADMAILVHADKAMTAGDFLL